MSRPTSTHDASRYVHGEADPRRKDRATFETKPAAYYGGRRDTGSGYERWRSTEWRPETARQENEDVYVAVHRLAAVAWCYPDDMALADMLAHLDGKDVHHESGVEWLNCHDSPNLPQEDYGIRVVDHARHAEITQSEMRAWAEDSRRAADGEADPEDACADCGATDGLWRSDDFDGLRCTECALDASDGAPLREA